jgi:2'-5' RNA ligase
MRAFIYINPDESSKNKIYIIQNEIKHLLDYNTINSIKWEEKDKFHLTLFFLGDITDRRAEIIIEALNHINNDKIYKEIIFQSKLINAFPSLKNPRVLFVELENADNQINHLYKDIIGVLAKCGFEPDKKFHAHITLGRVRRDRKVKLNNIEEKIFPDFQFIAKDFYLMESKMDRTGSTYKIIRRFDFD